MQDLGYRSYHGSYNSNSFHMEFYTSSLLHRQQPERGPIVPGVGLHMQFTSLRVHTLVEVGSQSPHTCWSGVRTPHLVMTWHSVDHTRSSQNMGLEQHEDNF